MHAAWNALVKSGPDPLLDTALVALFGSGLALALLTVVPPPASASWPFIATSVLVHVGYYVALAGAYRAGDLSHGYPIMRGAAPLMTALGTWLLLGEALSASAWVGVLLICAGVLSLGLAGGGATPRATAWAIANAVIICLYTLADGAGVRVAEGAERYVVWLFVFNGLPFGLGVLLLKRRAFLRHAAAHWRRGLAGAALSGLSYGIALWAMTRAPVAIVAALRETSVIFAALIGAWLLREGHLKERLGGAAAVLAGLVALKL
ncbi:MAG: phosphonate utilization protein [Betaproteobacteria bacterium]|nr:phosphonate utilization protein [Betaproteobacteria bacterium]